MIPKTAVKKFLDRNRNDYRSWKKRSTVALDALRDELPIRPPIWKKLRKHQRVCFLLGATLGKFAFFIDTGCGKTLVSIALVRYFRRADRTKTFLVLVPNNVNIYEWERELQKHAPNVRYALLDGSTAQKWEALQEQKPLIAVTTVMGFVTMVSEKRKSKKGKNELAISETKIAKAIDLLGGLIVDESTTLGNPRSLSTRIARRLANKLDHVFLLSGTPFGKDPTPLWSQMFLVDKGESLGETLALFRAAFFREIPDPWTGYPTYHFVQKHANTLREFIAHKSIRYEADAADLPRVVRIRKTLPLSADCEAHYVVARERFKEAVTADSGLQGMQMVRNYFIRMRQISSGFVGYQDDELGIRAEFEFDNNPKLESLLSMLQEVTPHHKAIVFCEYVFSGSMICRELTKLNIKHGRIYGKTKDPSEQLNVFVNDSDCRVLVLNNSCGGFGLNLQVAKYAIYYESPVSPIVRKQTTRRIERQGSDHSKVFVCDLTVENTVDGQILDMLEAGKNLFDEIISEKSVVL